MLLINEQSRLLISYVPLSFSLRGEQNASITKKTANYNDDDDDDDDKTNSDNNTNISTTKWAKVLRPVLKE